MIRVCNGTDPNIEGPAQQPSCSCGATFDDRHYLVIWPHRSRLGADMIGRCVGGHHADPHRGCLR